MHFRDCFDFFSWISQDLDFDSTKVLVYYIRITSHHLERPSCLSITWSSWLYYALFYYETFGALFLIAICLDKAFLLLSEDIHFHPLTEYNINFFIGWVLTLDSVQDSQWLVERDYIFTAIDFIGMKIYWMLFFMQIHISSLVGPWSWGSGGS